MNNKSTSQNDKKELNKNKNSVSYTKNFFKSKKINEIDFKKETSKKRDKFESEKSYKICKIVTNKFVVKDIKVDNDMLIKMYQNQCENVITNNEKKDIVTSQYDAISKPNPKNKIFYGAKQNCASNNMAIILLLGAIIGFVNGFWGGGGGMICVPVLTMILGLPEKKAHATTILIMLPLCISSFVVYLIKGSIIWSTAGIVTSGFIVGGVIGALILKKIDNLILRIIFDIIIIVGGIKLLF